MPFAEPRLTPAGAVLRRFVAPERLTLVDVGSAGGVEPEWRPLRDDIRIVGFEPDRREFEPLAARKTSHEMHLPYVVAARSEPQTLYVSREPARTSVYRPNFALLRQFPRAERFETVREVRVAVTDVTTLGDALRAHGIADPDFLKLDTQGSELAILQGAEGLLARHVVGIRVEVEFAELYAGQPLFADVDAFLRRAGFTLWDLRRFYWKRKLFTEFQGRGQLVFGDALYLKSEDAFFRDTVAATPRVAEKLAKLVAVCLLYRAPDYALSLLAGALERGLVDGAFSAGIQRLVTRHYRSRWSIPGARRVFGLARKVERRLVPSFWGFADADGGTRW